MTTRSGTNVLPSENGFRTVLALGAGAALLGFAVAAFIPRHRPEAAPGAPAPAATGAAGETGEPEVSGATA